MPRVVVFTGLFAMLLAVAAHPAPSGPPPGAPGYVAPWNRPTTDSVVDLDPGTKGERFELMDANLPGKGRSTWSVNFYPDSASWPLPNTTDLQRRRSLTIEYQAVLHRDLDGIYRTHRTLHVGNWYATAVLDSIRAGIANRYERAPWRTGTPAKAQVRH